MDCLVLLYLQLMFFPVVKGLTLDNDHNVTVEAGNPRSLSFTYTSTGSNMTTAVTIHADQTIVIPGVVSENNQTGQVIILPEDLLNLAFGQYAITVILQGEPDILETVDAVMFYEEIITGLQTENITVLLNTERTMVITLTSGSNVQSEWKIGNTTVLSKVCTGSVREINFSKTFDVPQVYNMTVIVWNSVSGPKHITACVEVVRLVEGFDIVTNVQNNTSFGTDHGPVVYNITLDSLDRLPMGKLNFELFYNDIIVLTMKLNNEDDLVSTGLMASYQSMTEGDYNVEAKISSSVDSQSFSFNLSIWNNITFPSIKSVAEINKEIFVTNYNLKTQRYQYRIVYGNGHDEYSDPNILITGRESFWSYNYTIRGTYSITIFVANPIYSYSFVKTIVIQNPVPDLSIWPNLTSYPNYFPLLENGAVFILNMTKNDLPPTSMTCIFVFETGGVGVNVDAPISFTTPLNTSHTYTTGGVKDVQVNCSNSVSSQLLTTRVFMLSKLEGFKITGHNRLFLDNSTSVDQSIIFAYTAGELITASAAIITDTLIPLKTTLDGHSGSVVVSANELKSYPYGTYKIAIELSSQSGETQQRGVALFYEEQLAGFQVFQNDSLHLVQHDVEFDVVFASGSSPEVELLFLDTNSMVEFENGMVRHMQFDYTFTDPDLYNVISISRNAINSIVQSDLEVEVVNSVAGFSVEMQSSLINSYSTMTFIVKLDVFSRIPMGIVHLYVDFDDGQSTNMTVKDKFTQMLDSNGYQFDHFYSMQGYKNVAMRFQAELTKQEINVTARIWDNINNVIITSDWAAEVNEVIPFNFENALRSGFEYSITFGDGIEVNNVPNVLYEEYNEATKYHSYNSPGVYKIVVKASNQEYSKIIQYNITIQYPIPPLQINPLPPYMIPIPSGVISLTIDMISNNPPPTDVTCNFKYEDSHPGVNETIHFVYGTTIMKQYMYKTGGVKNVNITCINFVTTKSLFTTIDAQIVTISDYEFEYPSIVPMNMTPDAGQLPCTADFTVHLFRCVRFTPDVRFTWDFNDGTSVEVTYGKKHSHAFSKRGHYNITVTIRDRGIDQIRILHIKIGAVDFYLQKYIGDVSNTVFQYILKWVGMYGTYDLAVSTKETIHHTQLDSSDVFVHNHTYNYYIKQYRPNIIAKNSNFTEILYYDDFVKVDFNLSILNINVTARTIFPPGNAVVRVGLVDARNTPLPFVKCRYDMGDYIDYTIYEQTQNISFENPLIFNYQYKVLGNLTAKIDCQNNYDKFSNTTNVESYNDCYTVNGIFDRQYANKSNPLKVYTSVDFDLASRMAIYCVNQIVTFYWKLYTLGENNTRQLFDYKPVSEPRGSFRFAKGSIPEDIYMVGLNVSLLGLTWIYEITYIQFVKPPPYAYIEGGDERYAKIWRKNITLDALMSSYDVGIGYGGNKNLKFDWSCKLISATTMEDLSDNYKKGTNVNGDCVRLLLPESEGIMVLNLVNDVKQGYAVTVGVTVTNSVHQSSNNFTQLIMGTLTTAPDISLICDLNCDKKYATMSKSIMVALCLDCEIDFTYLEYHWTLSWFDTSTQQYITEQNFESMTDTGINRKTLVILENQLKLNTKYLLKVNVNRIGELDESGGRIIFLTNMPPYGGSCKASNSSATGRAAEILNTPEDMIPTGVASSSLFAILCKDWKDEGLELDQDEQRDAERENPLLYEYFLYLNHTDYVGKRVTEKIPIYKGGESTASELRLPVGDPLDDYVIQVVVSVFDRFGDYSKIYLKVTVILVKTELYKPNQNLEVIAAVPEGYANPAQGVTHACLPNDEYTLSNEGDTNKTTKMLENFDDNYDMTDAGGNDIAVFRLIKSTAGFYNTLTFENSTAKADTSSLDRLVSYEDELQSDVQNTLQQRNLDLMSKVLDKVPENSSLVILPADTILIAKTVQACISNIDVMTENSSAEVSTVAYNLIQNIQKVSNKSPLPMTERENIQEATADVLGILSENVEFLSTASQENLNKTLTKEMVEDELIEYYRYHPEGIEGYPSITNDLIQFMYEKKRKVRERQTNMANSTSATVDKLIGTLDSAINVTSSTIAFGEGEKVTRQKNLNVSIEKDSAEMFLNRSEIKRDGFILDLQNDTLENVTATELELQVSVFKKSPLLHAGGHSQIKERIIGISVRDGKREDVDIPLTMRIQNEGIAFAQEHIATLGDKMEFISPLQDKNDAVLIYLKPEGFDDTNIDEYNFTLMAKSKISPSLNDYDFFEKISTRSWTVFGFKVFIPSMTLEEGNVIIAINAIEGPREEIPLLTNRKRRSVDDIDVNTNITLLTNMTIAIVTTGCRSFDQQSQSWNPNGCSVLSFSTLNETVCRCPPAAGKFFATSFLAPNLIDFHNVFAQFDASNAAVYGTMIGLFLIYVGLFIYFRRKDKTDVFKWIPYFMCDNKGCDEYFYMVTIHTGLRPVSGTKSNVCFIVAGENQDSGVRMLSDGNKKGFLKGSVCSYIMSTNTCLGDLCYMRIWHDNTGEGNDSSWYLHKIVIHDLQKETSFIFLCDDWLALDIGDGMIDRVIPSLSKNNLEFETLISQHTRMNMTENHLWLSVILRQQRSAFTRVQRLSCILALLFLAMISNAMFFQPEDEKQIIADSVQIGTFRFSLRTVYVSIVGAVVSIIPIFIVTYLFRNAKSKTSLQANKERTPKQKEDTSEGKKEKKENEIISEMGTSDKEVIPDIKIVEKEKLPHWVIYIAWTIVILAVLSSAFFLLLYSMQWGKEVSNEWLASFLLSFFESLLIVDPIKVLLFAMLMVIITKRPVEGDEVEVDLESVRHASKFTNQMNIDFKELQELQMAVISAGKTMDSNALKKKRRQLQKEKKAKRAFVNLVLQVVFACLMYTISYLSRDQRAYLLKANIENQLYQSSKYQFGFSKVSSKESFMTWINDTLLPVYFPTSSYNGGSISVLDKFFIGDLTNLRVGLIRMRQLRVKKESCFGPSVLHGHFCARKYDSNNENKDTFCEDCSKVWSPDAWHYVSAKELWGTDLFGTYNAYGGGGFINKLENDKPRTEKIIGESVINQWIDRLTRAVLVEFTLYNANVNMLAYSIFMVEFPETGGTFTWFDTQCFRPTVLTDSTGLFSILCYIILVLIVIVITVKLIKTIKKEKLKAIKNLWNIVDIVLCVFTYVAIVVWICKYINTKRALAIYYNDKSKFVNFQHIIIWEYMFNCILGVLCFACTIRLLRALGYNQRLVEIATVLKIGGSEILKFFVLFFFAFTGFTILGYLLFGPNVFEWRNLFVSFGSLTNTLIGRNSLDKLVNASPNFAEWYFFVYVFFMLFTMMTIFLSILNQAIEKARAHPDYTAQTIGISNIIKGTFDDVLQMFGIHIGRKKKKVPKTYKQSKKNPVVNTANVMHLVRETFKELMLETHEEEQKTTQSKEKGKYMRHVTFKPNDQPKRRTDYHQRNTYDTNTKASTDYSRMSDYDDKNIDRITPSNISLEEMNMTDPRKHNEYYKAYKPYL